MGLLDKLFGKKEQPRQPAERAAERRPVVNEPMPQKKEKPLEDMTIEEINRYIEENAKTEIYDHNKIRAAIRARALKAARAVGAEQYVLAVRQEESNAKLLNITEFTPISKESFVVFDLETTGLDYQGAEIVEIGACKVENGQITEEYSTLVCPDYPIPADATAVNHITNDMLIGQPKIYEVLPSFLAFVGDNVLAAHNVKFDFGFLANACMIHYFKAPGQLFDTMSLARYYPDSGSKKLTALVEAAGLEVETAHRALSDARMAARLILATNEKRKKK